LLAALVVWWAGRRDHARDPRLTTAALVLLAAFPVSAWLPKWGILPLPATGAVGAPLGTGGGSWWMALWLTGMLLVATRLALAARTLRCWRRDARLIGRRGRVELRLLAGLRGPVAAGVWRPVVFLPAAWATWDRATRRAVLLHELAHHARRDPLRRWIAACACAVNWFNPLVWWMARRLHAQCEFACDARVVASGVRADRYAWLLCDLATDTSSLTPALAMAERSSLEQRVTRLCHGAPPAWSRTMLALFLVATLITGLGIALLRPAAPPKPAVPQSEIELRLSADPFPVK
jgi:beta-lactamase regulating signal transducer with metallopeptidase domain